MTANKLEVLDPEIPADSVFCCHFIVGVLLGFPLNNIDKNIETYY